MIKTISLFTPKKQMRNKKLNELCIFLKLTLHLQHFLIKAVILIEYHQRFPGLCWNYFWSICWSLLNHFCWNCDRCKNSRLLGGISMILQKWYRLETEKFVNNRSNALSCLKDRTIKVHNETTPHKTKAIVWQHSSPKKFTELYCVPGLHHNEIKHTSKTVYLWMHLWDKWWWLVFLHPFQQYMKLMGRR